MLLMLTEIKWDMQMMQQNSYRNDRYMRWLSGSGEWSSSRRLVDIVMLLLALTPFAVVLGVKIFLVVAMLAKCVVSCRKKYKKPLVWTRRVLRLYIAESLLLVVASVAAGLLLGGIFTAGTVLIAAATFSCVFTLAANWLLKPVEKSINDSYIRDAKRILAGMPGMKTVAITGSYGKTSTKHYLNRILSEEFSVLMTPGSYNTPMGVVRTVREMLKPYNDLFIVEMGAKQPGDISEICQIVHPQVGIVTAVGEQHLESFKTIENVQRTKFELVDALPADGLAIVNNDFPHIASRPIGNVEAVRYGINPSPGTDYHAEDISCSASGTRFAIVGEGRRVDLETKLIGECNISNLMAAVIAALRLGVPPQKIRYAVSKIEQVEHRLSVKRTPSGITIIDDAFNSNPLGSRMALDALARMTTGKRIVITPGMIELGSKQEYYNRLLGEHIAETCDVAIIVGKYNRDAILSGLQNKGGMGKRSVHTVDTFAQAQSLMLSVARPGDTVLYENDLPDSFK